MRGLPDNAVLGTYKRLHRKPKRKHYATREETYQNVGAGIETGFKVIAFFAKPIARLFK